MSFTIKELEALSGIKAHTIRIWEQRYRFLKPSRTETNIRRYSNDELKTLLSVALLNKYGYKISRIDAMSYEERVQAVLSLSQQEASNERLVNKMIGYMIDMRNIEFEKLLNDHIREYGIEKTITEVIFYFLEKVGILWHTNHILPVQEHIVSNIVRQKILSAIDDLPLVHKQEPVFLLFLPEDEYHEMGLLFVYYLLRKKRLPVIYLGSNAPLKDVQFLFEHKAPDYLYIHLTSFPRKHDLPKYLSALSQKFSRTKILLSGSAILDYKKPLASNITRFQSLEEVTSFIKSV
ncbi:MAG: MerR family transcriptional regulator [Flavisolibacter sp.]|nr:MerR family transcriptional regulator [Flavisolibacter sp.]